MENEVEIEAKIIQIVKEQFEKDNGSNGVGFGEFDHFLNLNLEERNTLLNRMAREKKIVIFQSINSLRITLPK
ncbi:hypothetical protein [Chryseobacterium sp. M5A1_1a]